LAAHAAIAITNAAPVRAQGRELSMMSERNRLALELHDCRQPESCSGLVADG